MMKKQVDIETEKKGRDRNDKNIKYIIKVRPQIVGSFQLLPYTLLLNPNHNTLPLLGFKIQSRRDT